MYDPASPNSYRDIKVTRWKRAREGELANDVARALAAAAGASPSPFALPELTLPVGSTFVAPDSQPDALSGGASGGGVDVLPLSLSAEELHQRRVRQSAALGITTAVKLARDELEAEYKARVAAGMDRKGRIGQKLGKLMEVAVSKTNNNNDDKSNDANANSNENSTTANSDDTRSLGDGGVAASEVLPPSAPVSSAPLVFKRADLAAGGYVVKEDRGAADKRRSMRGKPSSTILIRFVRDGPPPEVFDDDNSNSGGGAVRNAFLESIQDHCGRCGVVRSMRHVLLSDEGRRAIRARLLDTGAADIDARLAQEAVRVLVRFDTVANGFMALESLQQHFPNWDVCFFPTQLFDAGALGPAEGEPLCNS
ncbi:hypothetical protein DQ04_00291220 [Trypanosoma grayi]|uniref:hypothetical protein n=1 Tax=Trypanosoma grayi TaxID=71804 RepID=UPI0004F44173|nr:hypothetical protein DQ04_00291220 [Trypanosoma grayi]KEG14836.1 hypothetical protein DQ04_00291220 [Trypanosoma grayi]